MKKRIFLMFLFLSLFSIHGFSKSNKNKTQTERTTDARFSGATIHGKYAHSPESVVSVEDDKKLIRIIKPRKKFKIQIKKSLEDYK